MNKNDIGLNINYQINNIMVKLPKKVLFNKMCDKYVAGGGEELTYTLVANNNSQEVIENVVFFDTLPKNTTLVNKSIDINGINYSDESPITASIPRVLVGEVVTITYKVKIDDKLCNVSKIENQAYLSYETIDVFGDRTFHKLNSNKVSTNIKSTLVKIGKFTDKQRVALGDIVTYVISISNTGNEKITDITLNEEVPIDLGYIDNSLRVDGECVDDRNLLVINLGAMKPNEERVIIYQAKVISIPIEEEIVTASVMKYKVVIDKETDRVMEYKLESNTVITEVMKKNCAKYYCNRRL